MSQFVSIEKAVLVTVAGGKGTGDGSRVFVPPPQTDSQAQPASDPSQRGTADLLAPRQSIGNNQAA
jgi:hypothetical protein